jgi:O-antigen biosynthesis protein
MQVYCPGRDVETVHDLVVVDQLKLFRNRPDLHFEGRIHEQVLDSINRVKGDIVFTDIFVVHAGADRSPEGCKRKLRRDIKLLRLDWRERPNHPFVYFNLGMTYFDARKYRKAIPALKRSLELAQPHESHVRKVYALLVSSHLQLGEKAAAREVCAAGLKLFPKDPELLFRNGIVFVEDRQFEAAEQSFLAAIANNDARHFSSIDPGMVGFKARHNLAGIYTQMGALDKSEAEWRKIVAEVPTYRDGWRCLCDTLLLEGKLRDAGDTARQVLNDAARLGSTGLMMAARIAEVTGQPDAALAALRQARREYPHEAAPLEELGRLLFLRGEFWEVEQSLRELLRLQPDNASARHNLGTLLNFSGRPEEAAEMFRASLRERPSFALTHLSLGYALANIGRRVEAGAAFEQCVRLAPDPRMAAEAQRQLDSLAA